MRPSRVLVDRGAGKSGGCRDSSVSLMVEQVAAASDTAGDDAAGLAELAQLLGADWLPTTTLAEDGV